MLNFTNIFEKLSDSFNLFVVLFHFKISSYFFIKSILYPNRQLVIFEIILLHKNFLNLLLKRILLVSIIPYRFYVVVQEFSMNGMVNLRLGKVPYSILMKKFPVVQERSPIFPMKAPINIEVNFLFHQLSDVWSKILDSFKDVEHKLTNHKGLVLFVTQCRQKDQCKVRVLGGVKVAENI